MGMSAQLGVTLGNTGNQFGQRARIIGAFQSGLRNANGSNLRIAHMNSERESYPSHYEGQLELDSHADIALAPTARSFPIPKELDL
jgi:hypothetical protein